MFSKAFVFWSLEHWDLFRISIFEFRISQRPVEWLSFQIDQKRYFGYMTLASRVICLRRHQGLRPSFGPTAVIGTSNNWIAWSNRYCYRWSFPCRSPDWWRPLKWPNDYWWQSDARTWRPNDQAPGNVYRFLPQPILLLSVRITLLNRPQNVYRRKEDFNEFGIELLPSTLLHGLEDVRLLPGFLINPFWGKSVIDVSNSHYSSEKGDLFAFSP